MPSTPFNVPLYGTPELIERFQRDGLRIITEFHSLIFQSQVWMDRTRWQGVPVCKLPSDLWVLQEIIAEVRPDLIIETGTAHGGSAAFMASLLDLQQRGRVVTIDTVASDERPKHPRIAYWTGSSVDPAIVDAAKAEAAGCASVLVVLDSVHSTRHVSEEMALYAPLVTLGSYLIVEDGCVDGNPVMPNYVDPYTGESGGPQAAIEAFVAHTREFQIDSTRHKFLVTFNPNGYLKRVA
jgi:cephalosporin hydroxylase